MTASTVSRFSRLAVSTSTTRISHGESTRASGDRGVPPAPGWRKNAILRPSGDQTGEESRDVDGARNQMGLPGLNNPIKLWSPRFDTNASVRPSGDHSGEPLLPRT